MPCQDDALKERSSMPPVSVTMQPRNFAGAEVDVVLPPEAAVVVVVELPELPQALAAMAITATAAIARNFDFMDFPLVSQPPLTALSWTGTVRQSTATIAY